MYPLSQSHHELPGKAIAPHGRFCPFYLVSQPGELGRHQLVKDEFAGGATVRAAAGACSSPHHRLPSCPLSMLQYGFNLVMSHPHAVNEIALSLNNKNPR